MATRNTPKWREADYTPFFLMDEPRHTDKEIRAEYSRLRDIARKRASRLSEAGLTTQAEYLMSTFQKAKGMSMDEVRQRLSTGHAVLSQERAYSLSGIKELQRLLEDESGADISLGDVMSFADYMRSWRTSAFSSLVAASDASKAYEEYQEMGGSFSDFWTVYNMQ